MSNIALRTVGLGKMYRIGGERAAYRTLRDTLVQAVKRPLERIRHPGAATHKSEVLWALRNLDLEVRHGEALGVIGRNGSGKSTLLKVLSRITEPTEGRVELRGRVASLLEVGTGFHGELTGRENVQLSGSILGMTRADIRSRFDSIVEFAEIQRFLDTPVKRYSSGMYVRLAFAVAAHLEPDILLVDEVLAVGDAAFQEKCLGKMDEVAGEGRTVLFVSHNMAAVRHLCNRAIMLDSGTLKADGDTDDVLRDYMSTVAASTGAREWTDSDSAPHGRHQWLQAIRVVQNERPTEKVALEKPFRVEFDFVNELEGSPLFCNMQLLDDYGVVVLTTSNNPLLNLAETETWFREPHARGIYRYSCTFPGHVLNAQRYYVSLAIGNPWDRSEGLLADRIMSFDGFDATATARYPGVVRLPMKWHAERLDSPAIALDREPDHVPN